MEISGRRIDNLQLRLIRKLKQSVRSVLMPSVRCKNTSLSLKNASIVIDQMHNERVGA